jgi:hypothetical protein
MIGVDRLLLSFAPPRLGVERGLSQPRKTMITWLGRTRSKGGCRRDTESLAEDLRDEQ